MLPSVSMEDTTTRVAALRRRIATAAARADRDPQAIELMAVSKTVDSARAQEAVDAGVGVLGENRVQDTARKIAEVTGPVRWHLIGKLQSNKAKLAARLFDAVHSLDRPSLVTRLDQSAGAMGRRLDIYVQVEFVRHELSEDEILQRATDLCLGVERSAALRLCGLMTMPRYDPDPEAARPWFRRLASMRERIRQQHGLALPGLSMGMSNDFEVAIEEGSTLVRVGTSIFGARASATPH